MAQHIPNFGENVMRKITLLAACLLLSAPAFAQSQTKSPETIVTTGIWRSDAALNEAEKLMADKKYVDALTILDQVIARNMRNVDAHVDSAMVWINLGNLDKAKSSLKSAEIIDKSHLGIYVASGIIALLEKEPDEAEDNLGVLRILCRGENCPEFQSLQRMIRETKIQKD
jgi:hypothetical protein